MQMQVAADRKKRAAVLMAEGEKTSQILKSEAVKQESVNKAEGEAAAVLAKAKATAASIDLIAASINREGGSSAVSLNIAEQYVKAFSNIAKESTTMLLPSTVSDLASMTASALSIFKKISAKEGGQK
ncbi:hypothetical protein Zmor_016471 [Zophobas morio]|jgi:regulator of protease activity HflC (stomatin/prohibitin superfamily)|uniref:STML2-like C-terminal extension domain-containing protein n=2 Tax=Zophobas morio TaxID=2755281 RepID=A0AA38HJJ1_9CUCU|nr:hypothetical protein Zmor_016471 [Zophobas morio]